MSATTTIQPQLNLETPRALGLLAALAAASAIVFFATAESCVSATRDAVQTVGKDSVPSIAAAEEIRARLARAHAAACDAWLARGSAREASWQVYESELDTATDRLVAAAQNITYGDEERVPVLTLAKRTRAYAALVATARAHEDDRKAFADASRILELELLPAAKELDAANFRHLDVEYDHARSARAVRIGAVVVATLVLLASLAGLSAFITRRFRRLGSLPIAGAIAIACLAGVTTARSLAAANEQLRLAKADAFDSVHALSKARALAFEAASEESLGLLAPSPELENAFHARADAIAHDRHVIDRLLLGNPGSCGGLLGDELSNITFPGEKACALEALRSFARWSDIDQAMRKLDASSRHDEAVALRLGQGRGELERLDAALAKTQDLNMRELDLAIARASGELAALPVEIALAALGVVALVVAGVWPRWREYAV